MHESIMDGGVNVDRSELQHLTSTRVPKTTTTFLKHAALTPAQKEYLYGVAASYSAAHVHDLITRHYMNVLHGCTRAGFSRERDDLAVTSVQTELSSRVKRMEKMSAGARNPGKSFLPKIPNTQPRLPNTSASKQTKSPKMRRKSPRNDSAFFPPQ